MALDGTATGLRASIAEWLDDSSITAQIPDFIAMCEARMNRLLRVTDQEARATSTVTDQYLTLPPDFGGMRSVFIAGTPDRPLEQVESSALRSRYQYTSDLWPRAYAISAGQLQFAPVSIGGSAAIEMVYWRRIPPLATNETNWLLTAHPDVYLYGSLLSAEMHGWNDARLPLLKGAFDAGIQEIITDSEYRRFGAAPIGPALNCIA